MLSKKILINGVEAYIQSNKNPAGEVTIDWIVSSIHRRINLVRINHDFINDVMRYDYLLSQDEILNLNGFDYGISDPDYTLIQSAQIASERAQSEVAIPDASFQNPVNLSPLTAVGLFPINAAWKHHFKELAQEGVVDWATLSFRQPFYSEVLKTNESALDAADGTISVNNSWGGDASLEYSVDNGANWQSSKVFNSLPVATYEVLVRDSIGNESIKKEVEILAFAE